LLSFLVSSVSSQTVIYPTQTGNFYSTFANGAGSYNASGTQMGTWANTNSTSKQLVMWRKFRTDASGANTSDRPMQIGDELVFVYGQPGLMADSDLLY
jgi:hypothetical protein